MADYWTLEDIAKRLGVHPKTLLRWYRQQRFLMFQRHRGLAGRKPRRTWYTNDELITRWQVAQCQVQWRQRDARRHASQPQRPVDGARGGVKS